MDNVNDSLLRFMLQDKPPPPPLQQSSGAVQPTPLTSAISHTLPPEALSSYLSHEPVVENISLHQSSAFIHNHLYSTSHRPERKISQALSSPTVSMPKISNDLNSPSQVAQTSTPVIANSRSRLKDNNNLTPKHIPAAEINQATNFTLETIFLKHNTFPPKTVTVLNGANNPIKRKLQSSKYTLQSSSSSESSQTNNTNTRNHGTQTVYTVPSLLHIELPPGFKTLKSRQDLSESNYSVLEPTRTVPPLPVLPPSHETSEVSLSLSVSVSTPSAANTIIENILNSKYLLT